MKNKGFTLAELLAVVVILGVIVSIAVPAFSNYILKTEDKYYNTLEKNVKNAGREYLNENPAKLPKESGYYSKLEKNQLVNSGIIENVVDSEGQECQRVEVIVRKLEDGKYEYETCLKCGDYETDTPVCKGNYDHNEGDDPSDDDTAPSVCNLYITKKTTNSVTLEVVGIDEQSGISGYSFSKDGGNTYISNGNNPVYTFTNLSDNQKYSFKVKCKNNGGPEKKEKESKDIDTITASFTNPTMKQVKSSDGYPIAGFDYSPKRDIQITYNNYNIDTPQYFLRSTVNVKVNYPVYYCPGGLNSLEQNNCLTTSVTTMEANKWYKTDNIITTPQFATDTKNSNFMLYAAIGDTVNISGISSYEVTKIDVVAPTINYIANPKTLDKRDFSFIDNVTYTFGFSGGKTVCNPAESRKTGSYDVTCKATGTNGLVKTVTFAVKHSYPPTWTKIDCNPYRCGYGCHDVYNCGCNGGVWVCSPGATPCQGACLYGQTCRWENECAGYTTCYHKCDHPTCPQGGSYNGGTGLCEF